MPRDVVHRSISKIDPVINPQGLLWQWHKCPTIEEIEQDAIHKSLTTRQERNQINGVIFNTLKSVSLVFEAILGRVSIRRGAFVRGERLIQNLHLILHLTVFCDLYKKILDCVTNSVPVPSARLRSRDGRLNR